MANPVRIGGVELPKPTGDRPLEALEREAEFWAFAVARRAWWSRADRRRYFMGQLARDTLQEVLGLDESRLRCLSELLRHYRLLEVAVPPPADDAVRAETRWARIMPWEYLLTAALPQMKGGRAPTILRHLDADEAAPAGRRKTRKVLYVESAPGEVGQRYDFGVESQLPELLGAKVTRRKSLSLSRLRATVRDLQPDVIHLAGVDNHQGGALIESWGKAPAELPDGVVLRGRDGAEVATPAAELAAALCAGRKKPELVVFNLYNSAGDLGYEAVAAGAGAAVGFQHALDDILAESFLAELYRMLGPRQLPLSVAVVAARERMAATSENRHGTGFAVWSRTSRWDELTGFDAETIEQAITDRETGVKLDADTIEQAIPDREIGVKLEQAVTDPETKVKREAEARLAAAKKLRWSIEPQAGINYALLHNQRSLFRRFEIRNPKDQVVRQLEIDVALEVGNESYRCRLQRDIQTRVTDLRDRIRLPLVWELDTLPVERAQTTLTTEIRYAGEPLLVRTDPVSLQPVDQWVDDDVNRQWLPSFVLPRDAAVRKVISAAQRYLDALADDYTAGFDGYQSVDRDAPDPYARIDAQVQAIWNALVLDFAPRYVNPPPTFELLSQRLRSPSDLLEGGRGTCIDLALLLAACLEYVEIFPAIVLLEGHAFAAYWRSEDGYYDAIDQMLIHPDPDEDLDLNHGLPAGKRRTRFGIEPETVLYPWIYGKEFYRPITNLVYRRQQLVPLEATGIPFRFGFWEAVDSGTENLRSVHDFHSLIDLIAARDHKVTPLPFRRRRR